MSTVLSQRPFLLNFGRNLPPGVFNMVHGTGEIAGRSLAKHPMVDMISFTGSTRAGIDISVAADSIKRVTTELGGNRQI